MPSKLRMWRAASNPKKQRLLHFKHFRASPRIACVLSSWRVGPSHHHGGRSRLHNSERSMTSSPVSDSTAAMSSHSSQCGSATNQTCVTCMHTVIAPNQQTAQASIAAMNSSQKSTLSIPKVRIECRYFPGSNMLRSAMAPLPRFGLNAVFNRKLSTIAWFGKGPQETYSDRQAGARVGIHHGSIASQLHPYLRPQETGNKIGVRWMAIRATEDGSGVLFTSPHLHPTLSVSAQHVLTSDLDLASADDASVVASHHLTKQRETQKHAAELIPRELTNVHIDSAQMGVGGVNSWGARPHASAMLRPDIEHRLTFEICPVAPGERIRSDGGDMVEEGGTDIHTRHQTGASAPRISSLASAARNSDHIENGGDGGKRCPFPTDYLQKHDSLRAPSDTMLSSSMPPSGRRSGAHYKLRRAGRREV